MMAVLPTLSQVHAPGYPGPGTVCLNDRSVVTASSPCQNSGSVPTPFIFNGPYPPTPENSPQQIRVGVYINGSAGLGSFTIILNASYSVLKPVGVDLTGTVLLGTPVILGECVSGNLIQGSNCSGADKISTIELAATSQLGMLNTPSPTSGLLFTAIFNITGTTPAGGVPIGFATSSMFCSSAHTSVSGDVCVTIGNGSQTPNPETAQTGSMFDNSNCLSTCSWIDLTSNVTRIKVLVGATTGITATINATAPNGLPVLGTSYINLTTAATPGFLAPTFGGVPTFHCVLSTATTPNQCNVSATFSSSKGGTYTATFYGVYYGDDIANGGPGTTTYSLVAVMNIIVYIGDVSWKVNTQPAGIGQTLYFSKGTFGIPYIFQSLGNYTGTVTLSQSVCTPGSTGVSCPVALPPAFTVPEGGIASELINFTATAFGKLTYKDVMTATLVPSQTQGLLTIDVSDYSMVANTTQVYFTFGSNGHLGITGTSLGVTGSSFAGTVVLLLVISPDAGLSVACPSFTLASGSTAPVTCTIGASIPNIYRLNITGVGGTNNLIKHTILVTINVYPTRCQSTDQCFDIRAKPPGPTVLVDVNATTTIILNQTNGFSGTVRLYETSLPVTGLSCTFYPGNVTFVTSGTSNLSCKSTTAATYTVTVVGTAGPTASIGNTTTVTLAFQDFAVTASPTSLSPNVGASGSSTITVSPVSGFAGTVDLAVSTNSTSLSCSPSPPSITGGSGTSTLSCTGSAPGNYLATVTGTSGTLSHSVNVTYAIPTPDFSISASPTTVSTKVGVAGTSTITVSPLYGFTGTVDLVVTTNSTSLSCSPSPLSITGGSGTSTLSCTGSAPGNYLATVTGTSGSLTHSATAKYVIPVPNFTISSSPLTVPVNSAADGTSTIAVASLNGFAATVTLTVTTNSTNLVCTLSSATISGSGTSTLSCHGSSTGNYLATVLGISGSLSHTVAVTYYVQDFTATAGPASVTVTAGSSGTSTVTIAGVNGFAGTVTLSLTTNSTSLSCTLSSTSLSGGAGTATLSCSSSTSGNYLATVTSTSGGLSHSSTVTFVVQSGSTTIFGVSPVVFYSIIGVVIAAIVAALALLLLRRGRAKK